jgi:predicted dehydrogenase
MATKSELRPGFGQGIKPLKVGVVGCGNISSAYLKFSKRFPILDIVALADLDLDRAKARASEFNIPSACSLDELLKRDDVEAILNLTTPQAHHEVSMLAIQACKHVYGEKPLAVTREEGLEILAAAKLKGVRVGCAPDTVLGAGHQTARKLIDDGAIGTPVAATAFMMCPGHESWHPDPAFYYKIGGGPMMDMGPYYLSDLTMLLGPVKRLSAQADIMINPRTITSQPKNGTTIDVETPDHITGVMKFHSGVVGTIITSFAVKSTGLPFIEIYGTAGSIRVPDPNCFGGPVLLLNGDSKQLQEVPLTHSYAENSRSIGLADLAYAVRTGRPHRITGQQGYHVLDVMHGFLDSSRTGRHYDVGSTFARPAALPAGLADGELDE